MKRFTMSLCLVVLCMLPSVIVVASPSLLAASSHAASHAAAAHRSIPICSGAVVGAAHCNADIVTDSQGKPLASSSPLPGSYGPVQFHGGYNLPCRVGGTSARAVCATPSSFGGQTIGIVDAYNDPTIASDLRTYDAHYGLPPCTTANGCFTKVDQTGGTSSPKTNAGWALEISLDVETAHEICQTCKILLVEATSNSNSNLAAAVKEAAKLGATEISNSYGSSETSGEATYDSR